MHGGWWLSPWSRQALPCGSGAHRARDALERRSGGPHRTRTTTFAKSRTTKAPSRSRFTPETIGRGAWKGSGRITAKPAESGSPSARTRATATTTSACRSRAGPSTRPARSRARLSPVLSWPVSSSAGKRSSPSERPRRTTLGLRARRAATQRSRPGKPTPVATRSNEPSRGSAHGEATRTGRTATDGLGAGSLRHSQAGAC